MKYSDIKGLTPAQIKDKFSLPHEPTRMTFVSVPANTPMQMGIAAGLESGNPFGMGGGRQYELLKSIPRSSFGNTVTLQK